MAAGVSGALEPSPGGLGMPLKAPDFSGSGRLGLAPPPAAAAPPGANLAVRLGDPIKALEMMLLEAQAMRDEVLDLRVQAALTSNRLVRLDNPMLRDRISRLKAEAAEALAANERLVADLMLPPLQQPQQQ
eukprot:XP_001690127.1 predicted protein [Chlamydomonas reinhardtii]